MVRALVLLTCCTCAFALNPDLDVSQYAHKSWTVRDGFFKSTINTITQTHDGYLWLGTDSGLLRFDGVKADPWQPPPDQPLPSVGIRHLLTARDGTLWIGTSAGLASWKEGKLRQYKELSGQAIGAIIEDQESTVWAGTLGISYATLCAIQKGGIQCYGEDSRIGRSILSIFESKGSLLVGTESGLWQWKPGPPKFYSVTRGANGVRNMIPGDNGAVWFNSSSAFEQFRVGRIEPAPIASIGPANVSMMVRDRQGSVWTATRDRGLLHVHQGKIDEFAQPDGLSAQSTSALFEDREGSIWVATRDGLDRFRDLAVASFSLNQGVPPLVPSILASQDGSILFGATGLDRWSRGEMTAYRQSALRLPAVRTGAAPPRTITGTGLTDESAQTIFEDRRGRIWVSPFRGAGYLENNRFVSSGAPPGYVNAMAEDTAGTLWMAHQTIGLIRHSPEGKAEQQISWAAMGQKTPGLTLAADPRNGGLWIGFFQAGLVYWKDGQVRASYSAADGLGRGVNGLSVDRDGTVWAATDGGLSRLKNGRIATLTSKNGLPCDLAHWSIEDDDHALWLFMACGLVRVTAKELDAWIARPDRSVSTTVLDNSDGVRLLDAAGRYNPRVTKTKDGKLWFVQLEGLSVFDPKNLPFNNLPPPVQVEQVIADRKTYSANAALALPPLTRDLQIDYTALSLVAPEKVRFRYKLEGRDRDWTEAGTRRQAFYEDLRPRNYRFRVMASNESGVWNEAGAVLDFSVDPAYYQTRWFQASAGIVFLAVLAGFYQLRLREVARRLDARMEERVNERTRIARDLHDTLLQSFQGVLLKFHAVTFMLPDRPAQAQEALEGVIEQARNAIAEGRDAVQGLRSSAVSSDLAGVIGTLAEELASGENAPEFLVQVEGTPRDLVPIVRDETYRIACEAVRNAFRHAHAGRIEVEIRYDQRRLRMRVRDDGKGIDPKVLAEGGRSGHHGLPGMQERARLMGGKLAIWSKLDSGTEAELVVPAAIAYTKGA